MREAKVEETPLTTTWKRLAEEDAVLEVMILVVPTDPPRLDESVLPEAESVFVVERLVTERLVDVALVKVALEIVALVVVLLPTIKLVILAKVVRSEEMKELVLVLLVE